MNKRGMAGLIIAILILNLLMLFSNSYSNLVMTETIIQDSTDYSDRARDAAFSGVSYVTSFAQTSSAMFTTDPVRAKDRTYFTLAPGNATKIAALFGTITTVPTPSAQNLIQTDWIFVDQEIDLLDEDDNTDGTEDEYYFRAVSFPKNDGSDNIDPEYYMVKSQGKYREFDISGNLAREFHCQVIAEIQITVTSATVDFKVKRWRRMEFEVDDDDFNSYTAY